MNAMTGLETHQQCIIEGFLGINKVEPRLINRLYMFLEFFSFIGGKI